MERAGQIFIKPVDMNEAWFVPSLFTCQVLGLLPGHNATPFCLASTARWLSSHVIGCRMPRGGQGTNKTAKKRPWHSSRAENVSVTTEAFVL